MKKLWIVAKNELYRYFISPLAYVYLLSFLLLNASFALYFGDFFNRGQADLLSMFTFQPWLYLLFIPGIAMRLWSEEFRNKTAVQIMTMPVSVTALVLGKFFAAWAFCSLALLLTFPFWITVNLLGIPDNSVILLGYSASFILAGCMLAISETMSALTKNQVIALVLAVIANLVFFWSGIEYILAVFRVFLPDVIIDVIASFSFLSHFDTMSRGLLELRDVIFFASVIIFFNFTTVLIVNFKTAGTSGWLKSTSRGYYLSAWTMLLIGFFGLNIIANSLTRNIQYDATEEKLFTLTEETKYILRHLPEPVFGKLYFSTVLEQRNPALRQLFDNVRLLLKKYKDLSNGNFDYKIYHPQFLSAEEDIALASGIQPIPLIDINQNALFGLSLEDTLQNKSVIPFFTQGQQGAVEQEITTKIFQMHHQKKTVGIISGLSIFGSAIGDGTALGQPWKIVDMWRENYNLITLNKPEDFDRKLDALILFYPSNMKPEIIERIKDYSRNGGNILLLLDPANEASRLYSFENRYLEGTDIGELADFWGIKFYKDYVVADLQNSITVDATADYKTNPTFTQDVIQFRLGRADMNPKHPITRQLNEIMMASVSVIMPRQEAYEKKEIKFFPLLKASPISSIMTSKVVIDGLNPQQILQYFAVDDNQKIMAAEVRGMLPDNQFDLIVVGDTDFLYDDFWAQRQMFLENEYIVDSYDNANFIMNAVDYLSGSDDLINLRGKKARLRNFENIENMRRINSLHFKKQENEIFERINLAKQGIQEVWNKKDFEGRENFTADELAAVGKVREQLNALRRELSDIRQQAFRSINLVDKKVTLINLWLVPGIIVLVLTGYGIFVLIRRRRKLSFFKADKKLLKLGAGCLFVFVLGLGAVYYTNYSSIDSYEGKYAFPQLRASINDVDRISLKTAKQSLTFERKDGLWVLREFPELPVYQERIRRLLTTVAEATFFERKTNKAENLAMFNLNPIEDSESKVMQVEFGNGDTLIQRFDLGNINIDLGRGSRAAFIKFDNKFQVWKIVADFIDMSPERENWTYSKLWDLRFGRFSMISNTPEDENRLLMLMKYLLNTKIEQVVPVPDVQPLKTLNLNVEDGNRLTMSFYRQGDKSYVAYQFDKHNSNHHLKLFAKYLTDNAVLIDNAYMEKILEQIK